MKCLDTAYIIDLLHEDAAAVKKAHELDGEDRLITTEITVYELFYGIFRGKNAQLRTERRIAAVNRLLDKLDVLPFDHDAALKAAEIAGTLSRKGLEIGSHDCMIAGIALSNGCTIIVTEDDAHFGRIKGINVETYG